MKKFEYKIIVGNVLEHTLRDETELTGLGEDGWELVSVVFPIKLKNKGVGAKAALYYWKKGFR